MICDLRQEKKTLREIAQAIGRSPSTVSRELRRNAEQSGRYLPHTAERIAADRLPRPRTRRLLADADLRATVTQLLGKRWSPEQVAHELREASPTSRGGGCARSRSTRRSTTLTSPSPDRRNGAADVAGAGSRAWSGVGG
jgi:transcriptional regulator with XRE-family HTH domain